MHPDAPTPTPDPSAAPLNAPQGPAKPAHDSIFGGRLWTLALLAAIVSGMGAWAVGEWAQSNFDPSRDLPPKMRSNPKNGPELNSRNRMIDYRMAIPTFGVFGGALGLTMGLAGGLARRSIGAGLLGGLVGLALGVPAGPGLSWCMTPFLDHAKSVARAENSTADIYSPLLVHGATMTAIGLAAGLAIGLGSGRVGRGIAGGLLGGVIGSVISEEIVDAAFPLSEKLRLTSDTPATRLVPLLCVSLAVAVCAVVAIQHLKTARDRKLDTPV